MIKCVFALSFLLPKYFVLLIYLEHLKEEPGRKLLSLIQQEVKNENEKF